MRKLFAVTWEVVVRVFVSRLVDRALTIGLGALMVWGGGTLQADLATLKAENAQLKACLQVIAQKNVWPTDCSTFFQPEIAPDAISEGK